VFIGVYLVESPFEQGKYFFAQDLMGGYTFSGNGLLQPLWWEGLGTLSQ